MNNLNHSRTLAARLFAAGLLLASAGSAWAAVRYVDVNNAGTMWPYTSWETAASSIQEAIEFAEAGDEIVVTNGIYSVGGRSTVDQPTTTNRVVVDKPLALRSVNGPQSTIIDGGGVFRCVYLTNGASLSGFTLTNGVAENGGGAFGGTLNNCTLSGNFAYWKCCWYGGYGGGAYLCVLNNCTLSGNSAIGWRDSQGFFGGGGGAAFSTLNNCTLTGNWTSGWGGGSGGGVFGGTLNYCTLTGNSAQAGGGAGNATLNNCTLRGNSAGYGGGADGCTLNNCILTGNSAVSAGGASRSTLNNSTVTGNLATGSEFGGGYGGGASYSALNNCIVYYNTGTNGANYDSSSTLNYSCTMPLPTNGVGNITNEPAFVNSAAGNYRLRADSPCIDAGTNLSASITNDLDGQLRPLDGNGDGLAAFDMGAYEYRTPLLVWQDSPNPTPPHGSWTNAAHTIQDAVDAAVAGDEIVVTNGVYATGGRAVYGGFNRVVIDKPLTVRSVNGPGFTIIHGTDEFPGIRCAYLANSATLSGFTLTDGAAEIGGGVFCESETAVIYNCVLSSNRAVARFAPEDSYGGGAYRGTLNNCTMNGNSADFGGGAFNATLNNCTLTDNSAWFSDGGGGAAGCIMNNCIVYFNTAQQGANYDSSSTLNYSCTTPLPTNGVGNITNAPLFVDQASGNLRLQSNSPCINAGLNAFAPAGPELDGNLRIAGGTVDIGAYESQSAPSIAPQLSITSSGTNVILAWPTDYAGAFIQGDHYEAYFLYSTTNLVSPVVWTFVYPMPVVADGQLVVTNAIDSTQRFYRIARETGPLGEVPCLLRGPSPGPCFGCFRSPIPGIWVWAQYANCGP